MSSTVIFSIIIALLLAAFGYQSYLFVKMIGVLKKRDDVIERMNTEYYRLQGISRQQNELVDCYSKRVKGWEDSSAIQREMLDYFRKIIFMLKVQADPGTERNIAMQMWDKHKVLQKQLTEQFNKNSN